jgi:hypothetical protein
MARIGDVRTIVQKYVGHECEICGEPATKRLAFLFENARRNPQSTGYGKDDISWCSDDEAFVCSNCPEPKRDGMVWAASFERERFSHMFHFWCEMISLETSRFNEGQV